MACLLDRVSDADAAAGRVTVLMVVGAGRGPLVRASLRASERSGRALRVYAVEKNPNAVITLQSLVESEGWGDVVTVVASDMREWAFSERADVLVSELRESSRKPEEIYGVAQRLWPGARCLELFARQHNVGKPGWVAVGNQLDGSVVVDPELKRRLRERYPRVDFA